MSALEAQNLLARLYTDEALLREFLLDRESFCSKRAGEMADFFREIDGRQLEFFADSLRHKRMHEVEKLIPMTASALGEKFHDEFHCHSERVIASGEKKHLADAMAFCERLMEKACEVDLLAREAARYESLKLSAHFRLLCEGAHPVICRAVHARRWTLRLLRLAYELPAVAETEHVREGARKRRTVILLARLPGLSGIWYW